MRLDPMVRLLPGERLERNEKVRLFVPSRHPSALRALKKLTATGPHDEIGDHGPSQAASFLPEDKEVGQIHLFETVFGRDALRVALDMRLLYPRLLRSTVLRLAELQGIQAVAKSEEEPGKIIHEYRSQDDQVKPDTFDDWSWPYYGAIDSTPLFIQAASYLFQIGEGDFLAALYYGRDGRERSLLEATDAAADWLLAKLATGGTGLLEFHRLNPKGLENQAWKDSWDSYFHADGSMANHAAGIASVEVQALAYDALLLYGHLCRRLIELGQGDSARLRERIADCDQAARELRRAVLSHLWVAQEGGGYFALATDRGPEGGLRQLKVRTSNMGHLLNSFMLDEGSEESAFYRESVIRAIFSPDLLSARGIRSLGANEIRYRPGAYHNGSVWLWDTHHIAHGLRKLGYPNLTYVLDERILEAVDGCHKFAEFVRGDDDPGHILNDRIVEVWDEANGRENRIEQPPQEVQAWTVTAILKLRYDLKIASHPAVDPQRRKLEAQILAQIES